MNDFSELESDLKNLRPAPVSRDLMARLERVLVPAAETPTAGLLPRPARRSNLWWSVGLGLTTAAALLVAGLTYFAPPPQTPPAAAQNRARPSAAMASGFRPSVLTQIVYNQRDEGLVFSPNQPARPLRRVRYETRETMQWRNPQTGASLRVSYPAEQVVLTPVSFQ